jgi:hypothetical protein
MGLFLGLLFRPNTFLLLLVTKYGIDISLVFPDTENMDIFYCFATGFGLSLVYSIGVALHRIAAALEKAAK